MRIRRARWIAAVFAVALVATACGGGESNENAGGGGSETASTGGGSETSSPAGGGGSEAAGGDLIVGTTDTVNTLDPAKCYSYYCSNIFFNAGSRLVTFAPGETDPSPELAADLPQISDDGLTYTFTLKDGLKFQDGSDLTSDDVKFSLNRSRWINHPEGAGFLLSGIDSIETPDPTTVVIKLKEKDNTFTSKLAYTEATIVPSDGDYKSPDGPLGDSGDPEQYINETFVGSGPYKVTDFRENESLTLETWDGYYGDAPKNDRVLIKFYTQAAQLKSALESGEIDIAFRALTPEQRTSLEGNSDIQIAKGPGAIRYLVFNTLKDPFTSKDARKAVAAAVDRQRIIDEALSGAAEPLYSMVPPSFTSSTQDFKTMYEGKDPASFDPNKVTFDLYYAPKHYGDTEASVAQTIKRELEESGQFTVNLQSSEWAQFTSQAWPGETGQYPAFLLGWYPDYIDADDYLQPFYHSEQSFLKMYKSDQMDQLIAKEQAKDAAGSDARTQTFKDIQKLAAEDAPIVPLYIEDAYAFSRSNVSGVDQTMDAAQIFRYYMISKS